SDRYHDALSRLVGPLEIHSSRKALQIIDAAAIAHFRSLIPPLEAGPVPARRNRRALFILSPPRSGSTLLRVMLAGHPHLFAPPELELLSFNDLRERRAAFTGRNSFWLEGTLRAIMAIKGCDPEQARL